MAPEDKSTQNPLKSIAMNPEFHKTSLTTERSQSQNSVRSREKEQKRAELCPQDFHKYNE